MPGITGGALEISKHTETVVSRVCFVSISCRKKSMNSIRGTSQPTKCSAVNDVFVIGDILTVNSSSKFSIQRMLQPRVQYDPKQSRGPEKVCSDTHSFRRPWSLELPKLRVKYGTAY